MCDLDANCKCDLQQIAHEFEHQIARVTSTYCKLFPWQTLRTFPSSDTLSSFLSTIMSSSALVPSNSSLLNRQWWRVCFVHGDQTKYYRQLYGHKRAAIRTQLQKQEAGEAVAMRKNTNACTATQAEVAKDG
jgi:hypothetical protein